MTKYIQYAVLTALGPLLAGCGPSKEAMCETIAAARSTPADTKADEAEKYLRCLNAPDDYVKQTYKELMAREKK